MPKVSVVMPSLNVEKYIRECIESVLAQTLTDIEILCVDAGSTDGTWEILSEYAGKDERIRLIHSDRKSYGYQMNLGIREATGDYIGIVETDDFIAPEMMERLYACAVEQDAEFVKADFDVFSTLEDGTRYFLTYHVGKYSSIKYNEIFTSENYVDGKKDIDVFMWNGIYKKAFLTENHIVFQETPGAAYQDCGFRYQVALKVRRGYYLKDSFYRYRRDNLGSSMYNKKAVIFDLAECRNLLRIAEEEKLDRRKRVFLAGEIAKIACGTYERLLMWNEPAEGTWEALQGFADILKDMVKEQLITPITVAHELWFRVRMLTGDLENYDYYAHVWAKSEAELTQHSLRHLAEKKQIVLFGSGYIGTIIYGMFLLNGLHNVVAFCDNDETKWNTFHRGCPIYSLQYVREQYPDAHFIIAVSGAGVMEIRNQLLKSGVALEQLLEYRLSLSPIDCMNKIMNDANLPEKNEYV